MKSRSVLLALLTFLLALLPCAAFPAGAEEVTGTVQVMVFLDGNGNAELGPYEDGQAGVTVYLTNEAGEKMAEAESGSDGLVTFAGVAPGEYRLWAVLPEDLIFSKASKKNGLTSSCMGLSSEGTQASAFFTVSAGRTVERGLGVQKALTVSGVCWLDENANGIMEDGEPRLSGVRITLDGQKNGLSFETFSGENGDWRIIRVRAGFYDFSAYAPDGLMFTRYSKTGGKNRSVFTSEGKTKVTKTLDTNDGQSVTDQHIGFATTAQVSGMCFLDANYNGLYDEGELPLAGVKVTAIKQVKDEEIAVTYSGEDGTYTLSGLRGNTYKIRAVLPKDGCDFTRVNSDPLGNHFKAREGRRENFWNDFVLADGERRTVNVGAIYYGSVSGTVYMDENFSGTKDGGENVTSGISVSLLNAAGETVGTDKTGAKGGYSFTALVPGQYSLRMTAKKGYAFSRLGEGNVMINLTGGEGYSEPFEVPLGTAVTGMSAGMIEPGTVRGTVFADRNDNGLRDEGENGLPGVTVRLMSEEGEQFRTVIGEDGAFLFDAVLPGRYYLAYALEENSSFARTAKGGNQIAGEGLTADGEWFDFKTADDVTAPLCGALRLGRISGILYRDADGSGTRGEGEAAVAGAVLTLTPTREDLAEVSVTSGEDGAFLLEGIRPDAYTLRLALPEGLVTSRLMGVELPVTAGLAEQTCPLTVEMGHRWENQAIGAVIPGLLLGRVWLDENNNGRLDEGEKTPEGERVTVLDEERGDTVRTVTTDAEGYFRVEGMAPGVYTVAGTLTENNDGTMTGDSTFQRMGDQLLMTGIVLTEGESREDLLMGMIRYTTLSGRTWIDRGGDVQPLEGVTVILEQENGETLQSRLTGEDGIYAFPGLLPCVCRIRVELPEGCVAAEPDDERLAGGLISILAETEGRKGHSAWMTLRMGDDRDDLEIGSVLPGTIGDFCWLDENGNGWQDGGEYGIPGVKVELLRNGEPVAETVSERDGYYWFRDVYPAVYTLRVTPPPEVKPTKRRTDIPLIVSSLTETEEAVCYTEEIAVRSAVKDYNVDLGFVLRQAGQYPAGLGEGRRMDWSLTYAPAE